MSRRLLALLIVLPAAVPTSAEEADYPPRWWKGNLHTHSLWSDGNEFPEMIADWYRQRGYHFLALTDHNVLSEGVRWMPHAKIVARSDADIVDRYRRRFGEDWVETRGTPGKEDFDVRLKPLSEFRGLVEERGRFLMIPAEEVSNVAAGRPLHVNVANLAEPLPAVEGPSVREVMDLVLRAAADHAEEHGREVLPHINHPNFGWAVTAEDLAGILGEGYFEVYNGHPAVRHEGDADHPGVEAMWDLANAIRLQRLDAPPLLGLATDDTHHYHGRKDSRPGRGWVMVKSRYLTPEHLIRAIKRGDFYASSGVTLDDVTYDAPTRTLSLAIAAAGDATFTTAFTVVRRGQSAGEVAATATGLTPSYTLTADDLYVRATVTSTHPAADPSFEGQKQQAWTQPVGWRKPSMNPTE